MIWLALPGVAAAWIVQYADARALLAVPAAGWAALALLAWWLAGGRAAGIVLVAGWTLVRAGWLVESRLPEALAGRDVVVRGVVCDFPRADPEALRLVLERDGADGAQLPERLHLSWYDERPDVRPGQRWQLEVRLKPPRGLLNPGGFDFEEWLFQRGIGASGYVRASRLNRQLPASALDCPVGRVRGALARRIEAALGDRPGGAYVLGVAVGATYLLRDEDWELMRATGTTHLLAISGLNIAMVAAPFLVLGPLLGRAWPGVAGRARAGALPAVAAAAAYSALSGFAVSTVRALVMLCIAVALAGRRRQPGAVDLLGAAALAAIAIDPAAIVTPSFWLSYVAVAWLFVASAPREPSPARAGGALRAAVLASAAGLVRAQVVLGLGLAPLSLALFHQLSLVAPFANLVAVPVFSLAVMPLALAGSALAVPWPAGGGTLLRLAADVVAGLMDLLRAGAAAGLPPWQPPWAAPGALALAAAGAALACWWRPVPGRALAPFLLLPALSGTGVARPPLRVTVMDVGQGLAVLVETPGHALLYDAGPAYRLRDAGESVVLPVLANAGVRRLDLLLVSHDDQDHRGGAASVLAAFPRARVIAPAGSRRHVGRHEDCARGMAWWWDGVRFELLSPERGEARRSKNDDSCVLRIDLGAASILLPGDIERGREDDLVGRRLLRPVDVVVAPHHGSRSSSGPSLVAAARAGLVVFSAGYRNRWGFPAPEVARRWAEAGACLLDTAGSGAVVLETGGARWRVARRERHDGAHLWTAPGAQDPRPCGKGATPLPAAVSRSPLG